MERPGFSSSQLEFLLNVINTFRGDFDPEGVLSVTILERI
jgi:hypothetical protein